jgi:hypothetical protein
MRSGLHFLYTASVLLMALRPGMSQNASMASKNLVGLPAYGITLSGDPSAPTLVNSSQRKILGYTVQFEDSEGRRTIKISLSFLGMGNDRPVGIPPGAQDVSSAPDVRRPPSGTGTPNGGVVKATLDAVLFDDGEIVGADSHDTFGRATSVISAARDLYSKVLAARTGTPTQKESTWSEVSRIAQGQPTDPVIRDAVYQKFQRQFAEELQRVRSIGGDDAAYNLAARSGSYPTIWRTK